MLSQVQAVSRKGHKRAIDSSSEDEKSPVVTEAAKRPKKKGLAKRFLDLEAVRDSSTDGSDDDAPDGEYDASFVDDDSVGGADTSMYLKSTVGMGRQNVRIVGKKCSYDDVFSQRPSEASLMEDYGDDSFVVSNDDVEYVTDDDDDELDGIHELDHTVVDTKKSGKGGKN